MLLTFVVLYLFVSVAIGLWAATRVHNARDYVVAGRSLPLPIVMATVFATWFGAETVLGVPATFVRDGLGGVVADPFGSSFCLVLVGLFFAARLYRMNLLTIGDFYRDALRPPGRGGHHARHRRLLPRLGLPPRSGRSGLGFRVVSRERCRQRAAWCSAPRSCWSTPCGAACGRSRSPISCR